MSQLDVQVPHPSPATPWTAPLTATMERADLLRDATSRKHKAEWGQFFTPQPIARFMASWSAEAAQGAVRILDPGAGTGSLGLAAALASFEAGAERVHLTSVEPEPSAFTALQSALALAARIWGERFTFEALDEDALDLGTPRLDAPPLQPFDQVISNPPYFKMSPSRPRGGDAPNAYARFMEVGAALLRPGGRLTFIVPRSFTSGLYFRRFRRRFHERMSLERVHLFDSRRDAFKDHEVLQENVIVAYRKGPSPRRQVAISVSQGTSDLTTATPFTCERPALLSPTDPQRVLFLPASGDDIAIMRQVRGWPANLHRLGLDVSTGPVVPFRSDALRRTGGADTVPLLWMQHVLQGQVRWPLGEDFRKAEHIHREEGERLLIPNRTCVLLRRFSAKEEARRLTVAVLPAGALPGDRLGLENHLNYLHAPGADLTVELAAGLTTVLSSTLVEAYFRIQSGNTQVSATELRSMPLPSRSTLEHLGARVVERGLSSLADQGFVDALMAEVGDGH